MLKDKDIGSEKTRRRRAWDPHLAMTNRSYFGKLFDTIMELQFRKLNEFIIQM